MKVETMAVGTFRDNPNYVKIVDLLIDLHVLMRDGKGETQAADDIRDQMDAPWFELNEAEQQRIDGMSADLYTLEPDSPIEHVAASNVYSQELSAEIDKARKQCDYDRVLQLLRERSHEISADRAAVLRGLCYEKLAVLDIAILLYEHGASLRKADDSYAAFLLTKLEQLQRTDRSLHWAREFMQRFNDPSPQLLLTAAGAMLRSIGQNACDGRSVLEESEQLVTTATHKMKDFQAEPPLKVLAVNRLIELALRYAQIGDSGKAGMLLESAMRVDPDDDLALAVLRGQFSDAANDEDTIEDLIAV
jgi:tetratricopeptide (TPR) repeat protein